MAVRSVILFIGVYFGFGKAADPEYAKLGGTITLVPTFTGQMDEILWRHGDNLDKVVEFDGRQNKEFKSFVGRTVLDFVTGELKISALTAEDSGLYRLEAYINNHLQYSNHEVQVIAEVAQPTIICEINDTKTASMATLQCNADRQDQQSPITYNWERLEDTLHGSVSSDQKLSIAVKDRHDEAVFQCSVSNHVSKKQAQFQVKNCFTEESSSTALAVGLSMLFLIISLIVLGLLLYYRRHRKAKAAGNKQDYVKVPRVQTSKSAEHSKDQPGPDDSSQQPEPGTVKRLKEYFSNAHKATLPSKQASKSADPSQVKSDLNQSEQAQDLSQQVKILVQSQTKPTDTSPLKLTSDTHPPAPNSTQPSAECNTSAQPSSPQVSLQSDQNTLQPRPEQGTVPDQKLAESVEVSLPDQKSGVAAGELITKEPKDQAVPEPDCEIVPEIVPNCTKIVGVGQQLTPGKVGHLVSFFSPQKSAVAAGELVTKEPTDQAVPEPDCEIVKAEQKKDSISQTLNSKEDPITANTPAVSKSVEQSQVQPDPNDSKAERDVDPCQQPKPSSSSTSPGELVGSDGSKEAEEGMEAGDVGEKKTDGGDDTSLGMDGSMETEDAENKKSAEDVGNMVQPSIKEEKVDTDESEEKNPDKGEKANVSSPVVAVGTDGKNANIELDLKKDKGGVKVDSQMEEAGSDEQGETGHQKQPDTDKMGQTGLLEHRSNPTQLVLEPEAIKNMLETNTELKCEAPANGHQVENSKSFSTSPGGEEGDEDRFNDTEKGMETRDGKTKQKINDGEIVEDVIDQNEEEAIVKAEQEKDLSDSETVTFKEDQITANTPAVSKSAELSQVQPDPNYSKAERDVDPCQQTNPRSSSSTSPGELVGSDGSNEAEERMEAGDVGEKKTEGGDDTSLGMDGSMETEDAENKKSV